MDATLIINEPLDKSSGWIAPLPQDQLAKTFIDPKKHKNPPFYPFNRRFTPGFRGRSIRGGGMRTRGRSFRGTGRARAFRGVRGFRGVRVRRGVSQPRVTRGTRRPFAFRARRAVRSRGSSFRGGRITNNRTRYYNNTAARNMNNDEVYSGFRNNDTNTNISTNNANSNRGRSRGRAGRYRTRA